MHVNLLEILRCPFCGGRVQLEQSACLEAHNDEIVTGILFCQCCAYPIVAGIPYMHIGPAAKTALRLLGAGDPHNALLTLLELEESQHKDFERLEAARDAMTFRQALDLLSPEAEGAYLLYRFSDPTFLSSQALLRAVGQDQRCFSKRALDLCGGTGHLTRSLCSLAGESDVVLADVFFWKIWLAKQFIAPRCQPVCCDANVPLPFAKDSFSLAFCSDAFHYIWSRRLLADEMQRLVGNSGTVLLSHLHNACCDNLSAGMPLTPTGYRDLFEGYSPRLFKESMVLNGLLQQAPMDLSTYHTDADLAQEPSLILMASRLPGLFRVYAYTEGAEPPSAPTLNPLYQVERDGAALYLTRSFPSDYYEMEYATCKQYLPERVRLLAGRPETLEIMTHDSVSRELAQRYVVLNLPPHYV